MAVNAQIVFYSMYGHIYTMAEAVAEGVRSVAGCSAQLLQVPELIPDDVLERHGAKEARASFAHVPMASVEGLAEADAIIFGTPTRFGNMAAQMRNFLDQTGGLWTRGALAGKVGSVFASTGTQHGGQETTITSFHSTLLHHGMIIVGVPYTEERLLNMSEITGGTPYGATTLAAADGSRRPSENELAIARYQGAHVAEIAKKLKGSRAWGQGLPSRGRAAPPGRSLWPRRGRLALAGAWRACGARDGRREGLVIADNLRRRLPEMKWGIVSAALNVVAIPLLMAGSLLGVPGFVGCLAMFLTALGMSSQLVAFCVGLLDITADDRKTVAVLSVAWSVVFFVVTMPAHVA